MENRRKVASDNALHSSMGRHDQIYVRFKLKTQKATGQTSQKKVFTFPYGKVATKKLTPKNKKPATKKMKQPLVFCSGKTAFTHR